MNNLLTTISLLFLISTGFCQVKKIRSFKTPETVSYAAVDRPGDLYLILKNGTMQKVDTEGKLQYSVSNKTIPAVFDPRDGARIFAYYPERNEYVFLSPTLTPGTAFQKIDEAFAINPFLVCSFGDYHLLILDSADWSFKKINLKATNVAAEANISAAISNHAQVKFLREYQNFIFLLDQQQGILIFNAIGKLLKVVEAPDITYFNFLGEELYYLENGKVKFFDLFTAETREMDLPYACDFALITDERLYLIKKNEIEIFSR